MLRVSPETNGWPRRRSSKRPSQACNTPSLFGPPNGRCEATIGVTVTDDNPVVKQTLVRLSRPTTRNEKLLEQAFRNLSVVTRCTTVQPRLATSIAREASRQR